MKVSGTTSKVALSMFIELNTSNENNVLPHVVLVDSFSSALQLEQALLFFNPTCRVFIMPEIEANQFSSVTPKRQFTAEKLRFLFASFQAQDGDVFIVTQKSVTQKTIPYQAFVENILFLRKDFEFKSSTEGVLEQLGYQRAPFVEDVGQYSVRGGILDIFSPAHTHPVRIELFGESIESMKRFSVTSQISSDQLDEYCVIPASEILFHKSRAESALEKIHAVQDKVRSTHPNHELQDFNRSIARQKRFPEIEFFLPFFYEKLDLMWDFFSTPVVFWNLDPLQNFRAIEEFRLELKTDEYQSNSILSFINSDALFELHDFLKIPDDSFQIELSDIELADDSNTVQFSTSSIRELIPNSLGLRPGSLEWGKVIKQKIDQWLSQDQRILIAVKSKTQLQRLRAFLEHIEVYCVEIESVRLIKDFFLDLPSNKVLLVQGALSESLRIKEENLIFIKEDDLLGAKTRVKKLEASEDFRSAASKLSFGDIKVGDYIVHRSHGIGQYDGLKVMDINGAETEFIQLSYREKDKLYLPVYKVGQLQRYTSGAAQVTLDKLGSSAWEKTKIKVRAHLKDVASDLLRLYAERTQIQRDPLVDPREDFDSFESEFDYDETDDQLRAVADLKKDFLQEKPMDRLICGDVGFGKTEIAMRAAFWAVYNKKQVALLAPTTVLTFQHMETLKKRFKNWPIKIKVLNRFVSASESRETIKEVKSGAVDIIVGTHRLLSKDVEFKNLGLLIIDEEQRFGVTHKEKIRKLKNSIDTLALSATPIPRTLNLSLVGIRDLTLINTAPVDRIPSRTLICKFEKSTIRKAILSEINRGGQVYFIHNRIQSIYGLADELKELVPEARIKVGHGQQPEDELERTMLAFFNHEIDVLLCTAIVESGVDNPRANTMFIDQAHTFGLSQLYQLRGRVGRSKQRAYCYLLIPKDKPLDKDAQERLKIIQENTQLGSGIRIAQYDLELRGSGNILGEEQSGHVNAVGYELYMDLLNESLQEAKGISSASSEVDPEINLKIKALIPDSYISDIRTRLFFYKRLADIESAHDADIIEGELRDQFGAVPEPVLNLIGMMLIRAVCKRLSIRDVSAGSRNISLIFTEHTPLKTDTIIHLASQDNKKYSITPDSRLNIRLNEITWPKVLNELQILNSKV